LCYANNRVLAISVAHPIPYQGSKRKLAAKILQYFPENITKLYEPFAGSAAISLAALNADCVESVHLNDTLSPLIRLWQDITNDPEAIADNYETLWQAQAKDPRQFFEDIRAEYNRDHSPEKLLYLLARCVKNAVRFNSNGEFNQSADHRRLGTKPDRMRKHILKASQTLKNRLSTSSVDYETVLNTVTADDFVYMDPPYQGTSQATDTRYFQTLDLDRFIHNIEKLLDRDIPFIVSFDGRCGNKEYGVHLPSSLKLNRIEIFAGTSSQATLHGRQTNTFESLYLSPGLSC